MWCQNHYEGILDCKAQELKSFSDEEKDKKRPFWDKEKDDVLFLEMKRIQFVGMKIALFSGKAK